MYICTLDLGNVGQFVGMVEVVAAKTENVLLRYMPLAVRTLLLVG